MPKFKLLFTVLFAISAGLLVAAVVMAWTNPSANPPGGTSAALYYSNGNVGIGTASPANRLEVSGGNVKIATAQNKLIFDSDLRYIQGTRSGADYLTIAEHSYALGIQLGFADATNPGGGYPFYPTMTITSVSGAAGNVGIGTASPSEKLEVNGNVKATAFLYSSDITLKKNIAPISNQLEKVLELQGVSFDWKADDKNDVGFIAQEVEKSFPEVVYTNKETGLKSVDYAKLTVFLVEAIKEQQKEIEELKLK